LKGGIEIHFAALGAEIYKMPYKSVSHRSLATTKAQEHPKKAIPQRKDLRDDKQIIIAIQNDVKFINVIMNCKKQKIPLAYILVESIEYMSLVIKNPTGYPLMFMRIPINNIYSIAQNTNCCYEFPVCDILSKDVKFSKNNSYNIIFRRNEEAVQFVYEIYNHDNSFMNSIVLDNIKSVNMSIISNIFKIDRMESLVSEDYFRLFLNMNIIILKEVQDITNLISFQNKVMVAKIRNYLELSTEKFSFVTATLKKKETKELCSTGDSTVWNNHDSEVQKFNVLPFESMFKINFTKSITQSDKMYYLFTTFHDHYMFIKLITSMSFTSETSIESFNKLFNKDYQVIECYACEKITEEEEQS
jgi:hypothetical protein